MEYEARVCAWTRVSQEFCICRRESPELLCMSRAGAQCHIGGGVGGGWWSRDGMLGSPRSRCFLPDANVESPSAMSGEKT